MYKKERKPLIHRLQNLFIFEIQMRKKIAQSLTKSNDKIQWRGTETQRIEAFSDSVFAFALTLLVVSLEVPKTFAQLKGILGGFVAFGVSFVLLFQVWYYQNLFFRRFGLKDIKTIVLNGALLFTVLFYVYPLKFLFSLFLFSNDSSVIAPHEVPMLMLVYGIGFSTIFSLFALMYRNAAKQAVTIGLNKPELFATQTQQRIFTWYVVVGVFAIVCAFIVPQKFSGATGALYGLVGLVEGVIRKRREKLATKKFNS